MLRFSDAPLTKQSREIAEGAQGDTNIDVLHYEVPLESLLSSRLYRLTNSVIAA